LNAIEGLICRADALGESLRDKGVLLNEKAAGRQAKTRKAYIHADPASFMVTGIEEVHYLFIEKRHHN
jgi:hypothetical protein